MKNHTPLEKLLFDKGYDLEDLIKVKKIKIGYPTLVNFRRGYKRENLRKKIRNKYAVQKEKGRNGRLFFPHRPKNEPANYWVERVQEDCGIKIQIIESVPADAELCNVMFTILSEPKRIQYIPDEITKKKIAKIFRVSPDAIYEDRSKEKDNY